MSLSGRADPSRDFQRFYRDHIAFVWAAARRFGVEHASLDDTVQEVFVTAHKKRNELDWEVSARGWLYGVTRRVAFRHRRSSARLLRRRAAVREQPIAASEPQAQRDAALVLDRLLAGIDATQRETYVMAELLGMSAPEIAAEHGVPVNTVYSRLRLAKSGLGRTAEQLAELEAAAAAARRPDPARDRRIWAVLAPIVARGSEASLLATLGPLAWIAGGLATVGIAVAVIGSSYDDDAQPTIARADRDARTEASVTPEPALAPAPVAAAPPIAAPPIAAPPTAAPAPAPIAAFASRREPSARTEATRDADLAEELRLLDEARAAIARADGTAALALLDAHHQRFPSSGLADVRARTRIAALCSLGRTDDARRQSEALVAMHPDSNVARSDDARYW